MKTRQAMTVGALMLIGWLLYGLGERHMACEMNPAASICNQH